MPLTPTEFDVNKLIGSPLWLDRYTLHASLQRTCIATVTAPINAEDFAVAVSVVSAIQETKDEDYAKVILASLLQLQRGLNNQSPHDLGWLISTVSSEQLNSYLSFPASSSPAESKAEAVMSDSHGYFDCPITLQQHPWYEGIVCQGKKNDGIYYYYLISQAAFLDVMRNNPEYAFSVRGYLKVNKAIALIEFPDKQLTHDLIATDFINHQSEPQFKELRESLEAFFASVAQPLECIDGEVVTYQRQPTEAPFLEYFSGSPIIRTTPLDLLLSNELCHGFILTLLETISITDLCHRPIVGERQLDSLLQRLCQTEVGMSILEKVLKKRPELYNGITLEMLQQPCVQGIYGNAPVLHLLTASWAGGKILNSLLMKNEGISSNITPGILARCYPHKNDEVGCAFYFMSCNGAHLSTLVHLFMS